MELQRLDLVALTQRIAHHLPWPVYRSDDLKLLESLLSFLTTTVQDKKCLENERTTNSLRDLLCRTSLVYEPVPNEEQVILLNEELGRQSSLSRGAFGRIYTWSSLEQTPAPVILKTPLQFSTVTLREMYVNYVLINTILLHHRLSHQLVASYGFFVTPSVVSEDGEQVRFHVKPNAESKFHMIQQRIEGVTLRRYCQKPGFTVEKCKDLLHKVWKVLIALESSPYRLYHNDLHLDNIMVRDDGSVVVLDWGLASFDALGTHYKSSTMIYTTTPLYSGANDAYLFLRSLLKEIMDQEDESVFMYIASLQTKLFSNFFYEKEVDTILQPRLEKYRARQEKIRAKYQEQTRLQQMYGDSYHFYVKPEAHDEDEDEYEEYDEEEQKEVDLSQRGIEFIQQGVFTSMTTSDMTFGYNVRKRPGYEKGVPYLIHGGRRQDGYLFIKGERPSNLYSFLIELSKYTSTKERREQLHALHTMILGQLTHAELAKKLLDMPAEDIQEAQSQCNAIVLEHALGKRRRYKKRSVQRHKSTTRTTRTKQSKQNNKNKINH